MSDVSLNMAGADVTVVLVGGGRILLKDQLLGGGIENFRMADGFRSWQKLQEDLANPSSPGDGNDGGGGGDDGDGSQGDEGGTPVAVGRLNTQTAIQGGQWDFSVPVFMFTGGGALSYSASLADGGALPSWLAFEPRTLSFSGSPGSTDVGALHLKITATNTRGAKADAMLNVVVTNTNDAPVVTTPVAAQSAAQNQAWSYTVPLGTFTDPDAGDSMTYSATRADGSALPAWLAFNPATRTFSGTPRADDVGSLALKLTATDKAGDTASSSFTVAAIHINTAPVVAATLAQQNAVGNRAWSYNLPSTKPVHS